MCLTKNRFRFVSRQEKPRLGYVWLSVCSHVPLARCSHIYSAQILSTNIHFMSHIFGFKKRNRLERTEHGAYVSLLHFIRKQFNAACVFCLLPRANSGRMKHSFKHLDIVTKKTTKKTTQIYFAIHFVYSFTFSIVCDRSEAAVASASRFTPAASCGMWAVNRAKCCMRTWCQTKKFAESFCRIIIGMHCLLCWVPSLRSTESFAANGVQAKIQRPAYKEWSSQWIRGGKSISDEKALEKSVARLKVTLLLFCYILISFGVGLFNKIDSIGKLHLVAFCAAHQTESLSALWDLRWFCDFYCHLSGIRWNCTLCSSSQPLSLQCGPLSLLRTAILLPPTRIELKEN